MLLNCILILQKQIFIIVTFASHKYFTRSIFSSIIYPSQFFYLLAEVLLTLLTLIL